LEQTFPEKSLLQAKLSSHDAELSELRSKLDTFENNLAPLIARLSVVESNAVHKGAVSDLISLVKGLKDEYVSLKASLGMSRIGDSEIRAMLNGQPIDPDGGI